MKNFSISNSNFKEKILAALVLMTLLTIYYNSVVVRGNSFMTTVNRTYRLGHYHYSGIYWHVARKSPTVDTSAANRISLPSAYLENHYLKTLQLPLWNPYSGLGRPYNADMNSFTFFLPMYLFKLFPSLFMYDLFLLLRLFIAGFFFFLLLRLFRCQFWIAVAGASFYMFNSHFQAFIDMDHLNVTMWLSPMAYFLTKFLFSMNGRYLLGFIFFSAGSFYGGNPNEFILIHLFVTVYFIFLVLTKRIYGFMKKFYFFLSYVVALSLSFLLSSVKLIPFIEFWKNSLSRGTVGTIGITDFLSLREFLIWTFYPNRMLQGPNYIGYFVLSLMLYSFFNLARKKWGLREKIVAFHFVLIFLVISKISNAPYIKWIGTLPVLNNINYVKYCSLIYFITALLSSVSLTYLVEDIKKTKNKIIRLFLFLFCCAVPHLVLISISGKPLFQMADNGGILLYLFIFFISVSFFIIIVKKTGTNKYITNLGVVILLLLAVVELRLNNHQYYRKRFKINDKAPYTQFLLEQSEPYRTIGIHGTFSPNCNLVYPIPTINRIFAMRVKQPTVLLSRLVNGKFNSGMTQTYYRDEILNNPYLDLLNTKYYISESIIDSIMIDPDYAESHRIEALLDNPSIQYTHCGDLYYHGHWGWQQLSDSSVDIPIHLPYGDVYLKSTALAFNFDWTKRENPDNKLHLLISVKQGEKEEIVYKRTFIAHRKEDQDFFNLKINLNKYAGQYVVIKFTLKNPRPGNIDDRSLFFGDPRVTYNKIKKSSPENSNNKKLVSMNYYETIPYEDIFSHHAVVYRNNNALERGFILYNIKQVKDINEAVTLMKKEPLLYKHTALIEENPPEYMRIGKTGQSKVSFVIYRANYVKIDVETTENGIFILSDAYYPGWTAYMDGKKVKIYPVFGALRAVFLPKGKHELIFCYRPQTFYFGAVLTLLSIFFLGYVYFSKSRLTLIFSFKNRLYDRL